MLEDLVLAAIAVTLKRVERLTSAQHLFVDHE